MSRTAGNRTLALSPSRGSVVAHKHLRRATAVQEAEGVGETFWRSGAIARLLSAMVQQLLLAFAFLFSLGVTPAQDAPPSLDAPDHWQVHNPSGPMDLEMRAELVSSDGITDVYYLTVTGTINGQPYQSWAIATDSTGGEILSVYNGDSETWVEWHWNDDHYDKVGGTANRRSYYPVY